MQTENNSSLLTLETQSIMKKAFSFLTIVCFVATLAMLTSCTDGSNSQEELIVGKWECTTATCTPYNQLINIYNGFLMVFNTDMTMTATSPALNGHTATGTYTIGDGKLTTNLQDKVTVMTIKNLNKKNLTVTFPNESHDDEGNPITYIYTLDFARQ